jgi:hypothetical protein
MIQQVTKYAMENIIVNCSAIMLLVFLRMQHRSVKNSFVLDQKLFVVMLDLALVQCFMESFANLWDREHIFLNLLQGAEIGNTIDISINMVFNLLYFTINVIYYTTLLLFFYWFLKKISYLCKQKTNKNQQI